MHSLNRFINTVGRCGNLWRAARLEGTGIGPCDHPYLFYICRHPGASQDALCRALYVNKSSVTRHLAHLEREGYVTRTPAAHDRRMLLVFPTQKALDIRPLLVEMAKEWNEIITSGFTEAELDTFAALLERALENAKQKVEEVAK